MKLLERFNEQYGFTRQETTVSLLVAAALLAGSGIRMLLPAHEPVRSQTYSYRTSDSTFFALSAAANRARTSPENPTQPSATSPVDINRADKARLMMLPGIGPAYAERILAYRSRNGAFRSPRELMEVKGIGPKKFERLRLLVTVGTPPRSPSTH